MRYVINSRQISRLVILMEVSSLVCEACGKPINPNQEVQTGCKRKYRKRALYWVFHALCYDEREKRLEKERIERITLICPQCGVSFIKKRIYQRFCSYKCSIDNWNKRHIKENEQYQKNYQPKYRSVIGKRSIHR